MVEQLYIIEKTGRRRKAREETCTICNQKFLVRLGSTRVACSNKCAGALKSTSVSTKCAQCGGIFKQKPSQKKGSKSGLFFCSRYCKDSAQRLGGIKEIMPPHYGTARKTHSSYRKFFGEDDLFCHRCGYNEFSCGVDIHHKDGNRRNNREENLIPLCACCHRSLHVGKWAIKDVL